MLLTKSTAPDMLAVNVVQLTEASMRPDGSLLREASNTKGVPCNAGIKLPFLHAGGATDAGPVIKAPGRTQDTHAVTTTLPLKLAPPAAALSNVD